MPTDILAAKESSAVKTALATCVADTYALMAQTHLAHWNVEGPLFFQLHEAFQGQYEQLFTAVDDIAERLRALDGYAPGGLTTLAKASQIEEMPVGSAPAKDFVAHIIEGNELLVAHLTELRNAAGEVEDLETQDLAIGRIQAHEKTLWMLRSFLKNL